MSISGIAPADVNSAKTHANTAAAIMPVFLPTKRFHELPLFWVLYGQLELPKGPV